MAVLAAFLLSVVFQDVQPNLVQQHTHFQSNGTGNKAARFGANMIYADNGVIKVGADLERGGSITYLSQSGTDNNVINSHDMGREVQLSFYGGPNFYNPPTPKYPGGACDKLFGGVPWPWNPIGAGDVDGNKGQILNITQSTTSHNYSILTRPLQWACHNVSCECEFGQTVSLDTPAGTGIKIVSTLYNHRSDKTDYSGHSQELPAVYTNGPYYRLITYIGDKPWTNDATHEYVTGFRGPGAKGGAWIPGAFTPTEGWAALVDTDNWGLGVINFDTPQFLGGFSGPKGHGGPSDGPTGYIAPINTVTLPWNVTYSFTSYLVLGDLATIRSFAQQVRKH
eukprot:m.85323 g.85323  ORF g.85323 m.85323 type:complete len:338 (+) comp13004_c0_seq4:143-1156(+)